MNPFQDDVNNKDKQMFVVSQPRFDYKPIQDYISHVHLATITVRSLSHVVESLEVSFENESHDVLFAAYHCKNLK